MAALRLLALEVKSLQTIKVEGSASFHTEDVPQRGSDSHLVDIVDVAHSCRASDLRCVRLVPVELRVDVLRNLRKRLSSVLGPEEVLRVEVVGLLLELAVLRGLKTNGEDGQQRYQGGGLESGGVNVPRPSLG